MKHLDTSSLIDEKSFRLKIKAIFDGQDKQSYQDELKEIYRQSHKEALGEVRLRLEKSPYFSGHVLARLMAEYTDILIQNLYDFTLRYLGYNKQPHILSLVAVGGYGRSEMAPFSDIDILFLTTEKEEDIHEEIISFMLRFLWDLKFKLGYSVRNVKEAIEQSFADNTICTSLLDARYITGCPSLYADFETQYQKNRQEPKNIRKFIADKLTEREKRHERMGGSRFLLEPNIKEGKGGLRDMQTLLWLNKFAYGYDDIDSLEQHKILSGKDKKRYQRAYRFIWMLRFWMHMENGRATELLSFDLQRQMSQKMGYWDTVRQKGVERLMRHVFLRATEVGWLTTVICAQLEENNQKMADEDQGLYLSKEQQSLGLFLQNGRVNHKQGASWIIEEPLNIMILFREAQKTGRSIHPDLLRAVRQNSSRMTQLRFEPQAIEIFWDILRSPLAASSLRIMGEIGILSRFIPAWGPIKCQMQYNMYHRYTTDEHTIMALSEYHKIRQLKLKNEIPWATEVIQQIDENSQIMPLSLLLHDIAKGRKEDHSILGAKLALNICARLGLDSESTQMVSWLTRYHLYMSDVAFRRDLDDEKTIDEFLKIVTTPEQLRYLTLLTICDIRAVGPDIWNDWKSKLLQKLFVRASARISGQSHNSLMREEIAVAQYYLHEKLIKDHWSEDEIQKIAHITTPAWWLGFNLHAQYEQAQILRHFKKGDIKVHFRQNESQNVTEMTSLALDKKGLFSDIAGALALSHVNIMEARAVTLNNGVILDVFTFTDLRGCLVTDEAKIKRIEKKVIQALKGEINWQNEYKKIRPVLPTHEGQKYAHFDANTQVTIPLNASTSATVIEVKTIDRPGLLFDVSKAILEQNLQIISARIATYGERVVDIFYVKNEAGLMITSPKQIKRVEQAILSVLVKNSPS